MITRRTFLASSAAVPLAGVFQRALANDLPTAIASAKAQFYGFLLSIVQAQGPMSPLQNVVLNSTIIPFDIATDTPFYNDELFRDYADRTFSGGVESIVPNPAGFLSGRYSSLYQVVLDIVAAQIDQNHPEIANALRDLRTQEDSANQALSKKITDLDTQWSTIYKSRGLTPGTQEYQLEFVAWLAQVQYSAQLKSYTEDLNRVLGQIDALRRSVYKPGEIAALENYTQLEPAYNLVRPWTANDERTFARNGTPLNELMLANPQDLVPSMFDSSPLILPVGDLIAFLSAKGTQSFSASSQQYQLTTAQSSWNASGGGSFLGWSIGGGGSGSSSMSNSVSKMNSLSVSFTNIVEYLAERSAWFNPAVFQDPNISKLVQGNSDLNQLQYVAVSLIIARGTTLVLKFSEAVSASDWSQSSWQASGGASFLGFSFGANAGGSNSHFNVTVNSDGVTVTIQDDDNVARVLGVRVEKVLSLPQNAQPLSLRLRRDPAIVDGLKSVQQGKESYADFQKKQIQMLKQQPK